MRMQSTMEEIVASFPYEGTSQETQNGFNFTIADKVFQFYYNNKTGKRNVIIYKQDMEYFMSGKELEALAIIYKRNSPKPKPAPSDPNPGTQKCIEHIENRIERLGAANRGANIRVIKVLREMREQFKEYL